MRYADDYVVGFESGDARRFIKELAERFAHCGLGGGCTRTRPGCLSSGRMRKETGGREERGGRRHPTFWDSLIVVGRIGRDGSRWGASRWASA